LAGVRRLGGEAVEHAVDDTVAAGAGELKDVRRRAIQILGEGRAQQRASAKEPRSHGRGRNAEALGRLLDGEIFNLAKDEHRPECDRQFVQPSLVRPLISARSAAASGDSLRMSGISMVLVSLSHST